MTKADLVYLKHIRDAIAKVEKYSEDSSYEFFIENDLLQDGVIRQIEVMGEATKKICKDHKREISTDTLEKYSWDER